MKKSSKDPNSKPQNKLSKILEEDYKRIKLLVNNQLEVPKNSTDQNTQKNYDSVCDFLGI